MEKIQSAIAKARAQREGQGPHAAPPLPLPHSGGAPERKPPAMVQPKSVPVAQVSPARTPEPKPDVAHDLAAQIGGADDSLAEAGAAPSPKPGDVAAQWKALQIYRPDTKKLRRNRIVTFEGGDDAVTYDVMRTRLLQQMRANNWRRVAVTSPGAGCGKTTTCLNLAFSLGRQTDLRTIVAELDLRRPMMAKMLGLRDPHGFAKVLDGTGKFSENSVRYGNNLAIATNSSPTRNPAELLHHSNVGPALAAIEEMYEPSLMVFDMPPVMVSDDTLAFVGHVDCVLIVAAAEQTTIKEIDNCERDIAAHTNVLGVVLNKCRYVDRRYGYSAY